MRWIKIHLLCRDYRPEEGVIDLACVNYDISELKRTEEELREAKERAEESNKLKSAFLANMSHEIRTPLNAIVGFSELLADESRHETRREYTDIILRNNTLLLQIISDVLDLARIESGRTDIERTQFDARDLCREVADSLRLQRRPGVELRVEEGLPEFPVTEYRKGLAQVLNNFTRNALKFTEKGSVTIEFRRIPGHIRFYVRDTGIGIAPRRPGTHLRTLRQTRHLHPGDRTRAFDLQVDRRTAGRLGRRRLRGGRRLLFPDRHSRGGVIPKTRVRPGRRTGRETTGTVIAPKPDADSPDEGKAPADPASRNGHP